MPCLQVALETLETWTELDVSELETSIFLLSTRKSTDTTGSLVAQE